MRDFEEEIDGGSTWELRYKSAEKQHKAAPWKRSNSSCNWENCTSHMGPREGLQLAENVLCMPKVPGSKDSSMRGLEGPVKVPVQVYNPGIDE